jgi:hypothetical protein
MTWTKHYSDYEGKRKLNFYSFEGKFGNKWVYGGQISRKDNTDNFELWFYHHPEKKYTITQKDLSKDLKLWQKTLEDHFKTWLNRRYKENKALRNIQKY